MRYSRPGLLYIYTQGGLGETGFVIRPSSLFFGTVVFVGCQVKTVMVNDDTHRQADQFIPMTIVVILDGNTRKQWSMRHSSKLHERRKVVVVKTKCSVVNETLTTRDGFPFSFHRVPFVRLNPRCIPANPKSRSSPLRRPVA